MKVPTDNRRDSNDDKLRMAAVVDDRAFGRSCAWAVSDANQKIRDIAAIGERDYQSFRQSEDRRIAQEERDARRKSGE